jgi:hypothetical protein
MGIKKTAKNVKGRSTTRAGATGGATIGVLKVPKTLQKCLMTAATANAKFKGNNWQRFAIYLLKEHVNA